jgi:NTE family protein
MRAFWRKAERREEGPILGGVHLGPRPWLVLGGGGLRGLAHVGAWRALDEVGFRPAGILGTSIGALVGACIAGGRPTDELEDEARELERTDIARLQRRALWVNGIRSEALFRGDALEAYLGRILPPGGWQDLQVRFQANAVELGSGREEWFGPGARTDVSLPRAVYASAALPLFYPPARIPGGAYVDGGVANALPLGRARELGATGIVAVDAGSGEGSEVRKVLADGMLAIHQRVMSIQSGRRRREEVAAWSGPPLLYVRPRLDGFGTFEFEAVDYFLGEGERAAREAMGLPPRVLHPPPPEEAGPEAPPAPPAPSPQAGGRVGAPGRGQEESLGVDREPGEGPRGRRSGSRGRREG